jgi:hypothetical protein
MESHKDRVVRDLRRLRAFIGLDYFTTKLCDLIVPPPKI